MEYKIYPFQWTSYRTIFDQDMVQKQKEYLIHTKCYNPNELLFLYDRILSASEEYLEETIPKIVTTEHEISVCEEVFFTNKIEGANTTIARTNALYHGMPIDKKNFKSEKMVLNGFQATKYLNLRQDMTESILFELWNILVDEVCENEALRGEHYRTGEIQIGSHTGIPYEQVPSYMEQWFAFYHSKELEDTPFLKAAFLHYWFETIHPFCDGNGRTGRMLMNHYLITHGYEQIKAISFSHTMNRNRSHLDVAFSDAERTPNNDCTPFLSFLMNDVMAETVQQLAIEQEQSHPLQRF